MYSQIGPAQKEQKQRCCVEGKVSMNQAKKIFIALVGGTVLLLGIALLVLPGPAFVVIPLGLAILATEFLWARRIMEKVKERLRIREIKKKSAE